MRQEKAVRPAHAGIQSKKRFLMVKGWFVHWIPAFAGMTIGRIQKYAFAL